MAHLIVREPGRVAYDVPLEGELRAGRGADNDLVLADRQVSRYHFRITPEGGGWRAEDLGSTHGVFVNGRRAQTQALADGDRVQIGNVLLVFSSADAPEPTRLGPANAPELTEKGPEGRRLALVYEIAAAVGALDDPDAMLAKLLEASIEVFGCERGLVGLSEGGKRAARRIARGADEDIVVGRSILSALLERGERVLLGAKAAPESMVARGVKSAIAAPIGSGGRVLGFIYLDDRGRPDSFDGADLDFLSALATLAGAALEGSERLERAARAVEARSAEDPAPEILGTSPAIARLKLEIAQCARSPASHVLIRGESGTGKELVARAIHAASPRAPAPFVGLNCAAIPEGMVESELFGFERGAFTGAEKTKRGKFVLADRGTLFLDEIGDLAMPAQAKLLRAIEEREVQPLGSEKSVPVDLRIVAATLKDLRAEVEAGRFREDLFYRLVVFDIEVPPLRERGADVVLLAEALLERHARASGRRLVGFTPAAIDAIRAHAWPGNVRELRNVIERAVAIAAGPAVDAADLSPRMGRGAAAQPRSMAEAFAELEQTERRLVENALAEAKGNVSEAARLLGISRVMMKRRIERFGV